MPHGLTSPDPRGASDGDEGERKYRALHFQCPPAARAHAKGGAWPGQAPLCGTRSLNQRPKAACPEISSTNLLPRVRGPIVLALPRSACGKVGFSDSSSRHVFPRLFPCLLIENPYILPLPIMYRAGSMRRRREQERLRASFCTTKMLCAQSRHTRCSGITNKRLNICRRRWSSPALCRCPA